MTASTAYELTGRTRQKARTRAAMVAATRELLTEGVTPTVEQAADRAGVSRTTAYRYFANRRALLVGAYPELDAASLLGDDPPADPVERVELVTQRIVGQVLEHEAALRAMLRLSLEPGEAGPDALPLRRGRAIRWLEDALEPLRDRLGDEAVHRLALAIRATIGIEALVWLTDVGELSREAAGELMRSSARALLAAALADVSAR
jgi:AcrR family transcriptional regulator